MSLGFVTGTTVAPTKAQVAAQCGVNSGCLEPPRAVSARVQKDTASMSLTMPSMNLKWSRLCGISFWVALLPWIGAFNWLVLGAVWSNTPVVRAPFTNVTNIRVPDIFDAIVFNSHGNPKASTDSDVFNEAYLVTRSLSIGMYITIGVFAFFYFFTALLQEVCGLNTLEYMRRNKVCAFFVDFFKNVFTFFILLGGLNWTWVAVSVSIMSEQFQSTDVLPTGTFEEPIWFIPDLFVLGGTIFQTIVYYLVALGTFAQIVWVISKSTVAPCFLICCCFPSDPLPPFTPQRRPTDCRSCPEDHL